MHCIHHRTSIRYVIYETKSDFLRTANQKKEFFAQRKVHLTDSSSENFSSFSLKICLKAIEKSIIVHYLFSEAAFQN